MDDYGNLDNALYILETYGAYHFNRFPYTIEKQIYKNFNKKMFNQRPDIKVKKVKEIVTPKDFNMTDKIMLIIQREIYMGHPIICAILEDSTNCDENFISPDIISKSPNPNHVVTILGYDLLNKTIRLKNNFESDCVFSVQIKKFCNALSWAYVLDID